MRDAARKPTLSNFKSLCLFSPVLTAMPVGKSISSHKGGRGTLVKVPAPRQLVMKKGTKVDRRLGRVSVTLLVHRVLTSGSNDIRI